MSKVHLCEVCRARPMVTVCCSGVGAMSLAYCAECWMSAAEPEFTFHYLWDCVADGDITKLHESVEGMRTWKDDRYWTWNEWAAWRTYQWFDPDPMFHWWAFQPHGPLPMPLDSLEESAPTIGDR